MSDLASDGRSRDVGTAQGLVTELTESKLRTRTSAKWTTQPHDVLPLTVAEMDYSFAEPIAAALHAAVARSDTGYIGSTARLAEALAGFVARRWDWRVDPAAVVPVGDVSVGMVEMLRMCTRPGDRVVISPPVHPPFRLWAAEARTQVLAAPLVRDRLGRVAAAAAMQRKAAAWLYRFAVSRPDEVDGQCRA